MPKTIVSPIEPISWPVATIVASGRAAVMTQPRSSVNARSLMTFQIFFEGEGAFAGRVRTFPWPDVIPLVFSGRWSVTDHDYDIRYWPDGAACLIDLTALTALQLVWFERWQVEDGISKTTRQIEEFIKGWVPRNVLQCISSNWGGRGGACGMGMSFLAIERWSWLYVQYREIIRIERFSEYVWGRGVKASRGLSITVPSRSYEPSRGLKKVPKAKALYEH